jgi:hypothetical protein
MATPTSSQTPAPAHRARAKGGGCPHQVPQGGEEHHEGIVATITEPSVVKKILSHLGVRTDPLPRARARDPTGQESFDFDAA